MFFVYRDINVPSEAISIASISKSNVENNNLDKSSKNIKREVTNSIEGQTKSNNSSEALKNENSQSNSFVH